MSATTIRLATADDSTASRCLSLIARHAPRLMRVGGGQGVRKEKPTSARRTTPEQRASIDAALIQTQGTRQHDIAFDHDVSPATVSKRWKKIKPAHFQTLRGQAARSA